MLDRARELTGYKLETLDGQVARVEDLYFDDHAWAIRYVVADTGGWLSGKRVLLAPQVLLRVDRRHRTIGIALTRTEIEHGRPADTHKPVSRRSERDHNWHFGMPMYWGFEGERRVAVKAQGDYDPHLRSCRVVTGYALHALDGEMGRVDDFLIEEQSWAIRYLIVQTHRWLTGKKVLLSPAWISAISWQRHEMVVDLGRDAIAQSPEYSPNAAGVTRDYELELHRHYDRPTYWSSGSRAEDADALPVTAAESPEPRDRGPR
jgi:hypothetical protein